MFPEGGSHDQTDLLPLKAGIAVISYTTMLNYGVDINIVACGMNYY